MIRKNGVLQNGKEEFKEEFRKRSSIEELFGIFTEYYYVEQGMGFG